jgi:hypothetical protein
LPSPPNSFEHHSAIIFFSCIFFSCDFPGFRPDDLEEWPDGGIFPLENQATLWYTNDHVMYPQSLSRKKGIPKGRAAALFVAPTQKAGENANRR